jgi:hypothetical protein
MADVEDTQSASYKNQGLVTNKFPNLTAQAQ